MNRSYDSNGPDVKVRGTAMTIYEKYQALARDASASGDRIGAENYLQHAEHYFRLMQAAKQANQQPGNGHDRAAGQPNEQRHQGQQQGGGEPAPADAAEQPDDSALAPYPRGNGDDNSQRSGEAQASQPPQPAQSEAQTDAAADDDDKKANGSDRGDELSNAPMSPAALVAEVTAMQTGSGGNGAAEPASGGDGQRRAPRRRRRAPQRDSNDEPSSSPADDNDGLPA